LASTRGGTMKTWLTVAEVATYAGVSRDAIYTACERSELRHARIGGRRAIRLKTLWIDAWLEQHARGGDTGGSPGRTPEAHRPEWSARSSAPHTHNPSSPASPRGIVPGGAS
jgi:excisionase family DNA binding protein